MSTKQLQNLDRMILKVRAEKTASLQKAASPGDGVEDGTKKPQTGAQMASNKEESGKSTKGSVDGGAVTNPVGASVEASTEGATAVATSGQKGTEGADLAVKHDAPNGPEKTAGVTDADAKSMADQLRKVASQLDAPVVDQSAKPEAAKESVVNGVKVAASDQTSLLCFLGRVTRASLAAQGLKLAAEMGDEQMGGQSVDKLLQAIQSGAISEEDAEKMLMEMAQQGAIKPEELQAIMAEMHGAGGGAAGAGAPPADPAAAGAPPMDAGAPMGAGVPPAPAPAAPMGAGPGAGGAGDQVNDPALEAKMACLDIGPGHPLYADKCVRLYPVAAQHGFDLFVKAAEMILGEEKHPADAGADKAPVDAGQPADKAPMAPEAPAAPAPHEGHDAVLAPKSPEEIEALKHVLEQMGIKPEDLQQLMATPAPAQHHDPAQAKMASYRIAVRTAIMAKAAALDDAAANPIK